MRDIREITKNCTDPRIVQDKLLLFSWPEGTGPRWELDKTSGLDCLTVIIRIINSQLTSEERSATHPLRKREEQYQLFRHAWLDFRPCDGERHAKAKVDVCASLPSRNGLSFQELISSELLQSTLWTRWEYAFFVLPIVSETAPESQWKTRSACFSIARSDPSAPPDLGKLMD
ncbi:hypothetical protein CSAL01_04765 [Colletotrichum salicis]|uniref:Uncharacterized protein n=1 Tax=Colletotrichum salicis TaxID=1209931 RepID=A0A135RU35_9PEZI|nr:hypothetical protein CSAL01_04765 [Colletotrichum salicis]